MSQRRGFIAAIIIAVSCSLPLSVSSGSRSLTARVTGSIYAINLDHWNRREVSRSDRINYQRAIDEVYWRHSNWPAGTAKPELDRVASLAGTAARVDNYLSKSNTLKPGTLISDEMLIAEVRRIFSTTRNPEMLGEICAALGNDPYLIAECVARPLLVNRVSVNSPVAVPSAAVPEGCDDAWSATSSAGTLSGRYGATAVWTGTELLIWGGYGDNNYWNTGARYDPAVNAWSPISTVGAPTGRRYHVAVWSGSEMIVWGGSSKSSFFNNTGGRYNPFNDTWVPMTTANAPSGRYAHTAVWTGREMIVWGGNASTVFTTTGALYYPTSDSWVPMSQPSGFGGRRYHTAIWTGNEMIVWGGQASTDLNTGARYNPSSNSWALISTAGAPSPRSLHTAVWTGGEMIVWGGSQSSSPYYLGTGARYNPSTDRWTSVSTSGAPGPRTDHSAVWTGREMIVWGGASSLGSVNTGGRFDPSTNTWRATTLAGAPSPRYFHSAVWTGTEMLIWGPDGGAGSQYCAGASSQPPPPPPPPQCNCEINPTSQKFPAAGGTSTISVTAGGGCSWSATSSVSWITITSGAGTGNGEVSYSVAANRTRATRSGSIQVAGQTVVISQRRR